MRVQIQLHITVVKIFLYFVWCSSTAGISPGFSLLHLIVSLFKHDSTKAMLKKELLDEAPIVQERTHVIKARRARKQKYFCLVSTFFVVV